VAGAEAYLHAKFTVESLNCLATIHQRYRETVRQTGQWSNSIGQTVLQIVDQKVVVLYSSVVTLIPKINFMCLVV